MDHMTSFAFVLNFCRVNARTIYAMNHSKGLKSQNLFDFGLDLVISLVLPCTRVRPRNIITNEIQAKIKIILGETISSPQISSDVLFPAKLKKEKTE